MLSSELPHLSVNLARAMLLFPPDSLLLPLLVQFPFTLLTALSLQVISMSSLDAVKLVMELPSLWQPVTLRHKGVICHYLLVEALLVVMCVLPAGPDL
jgi:hypothetical protein